MADEKKTALVIGGCRGIGRSVALRLAQDGFDIYASCRKKGEASETLTAEISALGRACTILEFDVCDREGARKVLAEHFADNAPDAVVYNSGITADNLFVFMENSEWERVIDTNLNGFYNTVQVLVFGMLAKRRGRIVVISSRPLQTKSGFWSPSSTRFPREFS